MPQALPEIQGVDNTQNWLAATRAGITDRQLQQNYDIQNQNRLMRQNVGNALAGENPDMPDSQKQALQGGDFDLYGQLQKWSKQASDDELATVQKQHELTANLLANIKTPQQLEMALGVAQNTKAISPDEAAQIRDQVQKFGLEPTLQYHAAVVGKQNDAIRAAQDQRQQAYKDIGQVAAQYQGDPDRWLTEGVPALKAAGYNVDDIASPAGLNIAIGRAGLGGQVMGNEAKADAAAAKAASGGGKQLALNAGTQRVLDEFVANHPEWKGREAEIGALAQTAYQNKTGLDLGDDGKPKLASAAGTMLNFRANQQNPDVQREISEYKTLGKEDGALAQRKAIAGGALNHLETVSQIGDQDLENALGVIHGSGGYQKFADLVNSGRVENSAAYRNAKQTLAVLTREVENAYHIAGTGADTDSRMAETKEALSPESLLQSPNIEVFRQRLSNIRAILQGVINSPRPSSFGSRSPNTAGSAATEAEVRRVSGAPEAGGQVQRLQPGKVYKWNPATNRVEE